MKYTCKVISAILSVVLLLAISTQVFADTQQTTITLDIPEKFTWSVTDSVNVGQDIEVAITSSKLCDGSYITVQLTNSTNYDSEGQFVLTAPGSTSKPQYVLEAKSPDVEIESLPYTVINMPTSTGTNRTIETSWNTSAPYAAGSYSDTLTFEAELHSVND